MFDTPTRPAAVVGADGVDSDKADEAETAAVDEDDAEVRRMGQA